MVSCCSKKSSSSLSHQKYNFCKVQSCYGVTGPTLLSLAPPKTCIACHRLADGAPCQVLGSAKYYTISKGAERTSRRQVDKGLQPHLGVQAPQLGSLAFFVLCCSREPSPWCLAMNLSSSLAYVAIVFLKFTEIVDISWY